MITVSRGDWRKPVYAQESKELYYANLRKPLGGMEGRDPTTGSLSRELMLMGAKSLSQVVQDGMHSELQLTTGFSRAAWVWGMGYVLRERLTDPRVALVVGTAAVETTSNYMQFEELRQEMLDDEAAADMTGDSMLRADARRSMIEYFGVRSLHRVTGRGNILVVKYIGDGLATLVAGGSWGGIIHEIATLVFPELAGCYTPLGMMEKTAAMTNAIASLPRDQREGTANALIPVYAELAGDLAADLASICDFIETTTGQQLAIIGHHVAATNNHSRYSMLAVFLSAARLGAVSLSEVAHVWTAKAITYAKRIVVPTLCVSTTQKARELRIIDAVGRLSSQIKIAVQDSSDVAIASAQLALHKFIDEEVQGICWQRTDPTVLWAICAALFWTMAKLDGISNLLLRGNSFKSLYIEREGFEDIWLRLVYASRS